MLTPAAISSRLREHGHRLLMVHAPRGFFPLLNGGELAIVYCFVFLYLWLAGGGEWSLDRLRTPASAPPYRRAGPEHHCLIQVVCMTFSKSVMGGGPAELRSKLASLCPIGQDHPFVL